MTPRRHAPFTLLALGLLSLGAILATPTSSLAQDERAVETARELLAKRATPAEVARELASDFRLDATGVAEVLAAAGVDATAAAAGLLDGLQTRPEAIVAALVEAGYPDDAVARAAERLRVAPAAVASAYRSTGDSWERAGDALETAGLTREKAAAALAEAGYGAREAASGLVARRVEGREAADVLRRTGYDTEASVAAVAEAYRLDGPATASVLREAGYDAEEAARGLVQVVSGQAEVVNSLESAEYDPGEIRQVAISVLQLSPEEWAAQSKESGATVIETAEVLALDFGLGPVESGDVLLFPPVQYSTGDFASALRLVWELDIFEAYDVMSQLISAGVIPQLIQGGYEAPRPTIHEYRIVDYRPGHSGQVIENLGVVDPDAVGPGSPDDSDGRVEVLVPFRDLDGIEATIGGRVGEIVDRTPHTYVADGVEHQGEWLTIEFRDFESGNLRLTRAGRSGTANVIRLSYKWTEPDAIVDRLGDLTVEIGDPLGEGVVSAEPTTWESIPLEGIEETFEVSPLQGLGMTAEVVDLESNAVSVDVSPAGEGVISIAIEIGFEEDGAEIDGTFLDYIPCWTCSTFEVPTSECSTLDVQCFLNVLGEAGTSLGTCLNPANWEEQEVASGPEVPFEVDLVAPTLRLSWTVGADGNGGFYAQTALPEFETGLSLRSGNGIDLAPIEGWVLGEVSTKLLAAVEAADLSGSVVQALETFASVKGWGYVRGLYLLNDGRWFADTGS